MNRTAWVLLGVFGLACLVGLLVFREGSAGVHEAASPIGQVGAAAPAPRPELELDPSPRAAEISGRTVDEETGLAIESAELELRLTNGDVVDRGRADAAGRFTLRAPAAGIACEVWARHPEYGEAAAQVTAPQRGVTVQLGRYRPFTGITVDEQGNGVEAKLEIQPERGFVMREKTAADGTFAVSTLAAGRYSLFARSGSRSATTDLTLPLQAPLRIVLTPTPHVTGVLLDEHGKPVPNGFVELTRAVNRGNVTSLSDSGRHQSDAKGEFDVETFGAGHYTLTAKAQGLNTTRNELGPVLANVRVKVTLRAAGMVFGRVVTGRGEPVTRFMIDSERFETADGTFTTTLTNGQTSMLISAGSGRLMSVPVPRDRPPLFDAGTLSFPLKRTVRVRVTDSQTGEPLMNANIYSMEKNGSGSTLGFTGEGGVAEAEVAPGDAQVEIDHAGHQPAFVRLLASETEKEVKLDRGGKLKLKVEDPRHRPIAANISLMREGVASRQRSVPAGVTAVFDTLAPGRWIFAARSQNDKAQSAREVTVPERGEVELTLTLAPKNTKLIVEVVAEDGFAAHWVKLVPALAPVPTKLRDFDWSGLADLEPVKDSVSVFDEVAEGAYHVVVVMLDRAKKTDVFYVTQLTVGSESEQRVRVMRPPGARLVPDE